MPAQTLSSNVDARSMTPKTTHLPRRPVALLLAASCLGPTTPVEAAPAAEPPVSGAAAASSGFAGSRSAELQVQQRLRMLSCKRHPQTCVQGAASSAASTPRSGSAPPASRSD
jgi:hypothetical protein